MTAKKVVFQKSHQRFDVHAGDAIARLGTPAGAAYHARVAEETETLWSNLCPLEDYPRRIFRAKTRMRNPMNVIERLKKSKDARNREWLLHGGFIYSFDDLSFAAYRDVHYQRVPDNWGQTYRSSTRGYVVFHGLKKHVIRHELGWACLELIGTKNAVRVAKIGQFKVQLERPQRHRF